MALPLLEKRGAGAALLIVGELGVGREVGGWIVKGAVAGSYSREKEGALGYTIDRWMGSGWEEKWVGEVTVGVE